MPTKKILMYNSGIKTIVEILKYIPSLSSLLLKNYNFGWMFKRVSKVSLSWLLEAANYCLCLCFDGKHMAKWDGITWPYSNLKRARHLNKHRTNNIKTLIY